MALYIPKLNRLPRKKFTYTNTHNFFDPHPIYGFILFIHQNVEKNCSVNQFKRNFEFNYGI